MRLQNRLLRAIGNHDRRTRVSDLHVAIKIPNVYVCINKIRTQQAEIIQNNLNPNAHTIGKEQAKHRK
jgi:hypothetical protein